MYAPADLRNFQLDCYFCKHLPYILKESFRMKESWRDEGITFLQQCFVDHYFLYEYMSNMNAQ